MAKRRKARTRTIVRKAKASYRRAKKEPIFNTILPAMLYGAGREKIAQTISPLTEKLPMGNLADNVSMGIASYLAVKKGKGIIKKMGQAGLLIESAQIGQELVQGGFNLGSNNDNGSW